MTLDEAIKHCEEKAKEQKKEAEIYNYLHSKYCKERAEEHEQLAEWLTELKKLRETMEMIKKNYILIEKSPRDNPNDFMMGKVVPDVLQGWRYKE